MCGVDAKRKLRIDGNMDDSDKLDPMTPRWESQQMDGKFTVLA